VHLRAPVHARDPALRAREQLGREVPERADHPGLDQLDLAVQEWPAGVDLVGLGIAVAGRARLQHVGDEDVVAGEADLLQELVQELPGPAHERQALLVLVHAGRLTDEHQVGVRVARSEHHLRPGLEERTALAGRRLPVQLDELGAALLRAA
jgi:hypothetical protein